MSKKQPAKKTAPKKTDSEIAADAAMSILVGISVLSDVDKYTLAALVDWLRNHWRGDHAEVANGGKIGAALERIKREADRARVQVVVDAAENNLRAAVTA